MGLSSVRIAMDTTLVAETCWVCGITWAMPANWARRRSEKGQAFYCPNGDKLLYGESEIDRVKRQLDESIRQTNYQRTLREGVERSLRSTRGVLTRTRKRIGAGVCPCCTRSFSNLRRHMAMKHPDFKDQEVGK